VNELEEILHKYHQKALLEKMETFSEKEKEQLLKQLKKCNILTFSKKIKKNFFHNAKPLTKVHVENFEEACIGRKAIEKQLVGVVILAGGQGSRLGHFGPKGTFVLDKIQKSLFQILFEKIYRIETFLNVKIPVAIMVSKENEIETKKYLKENQYFHLSEEFVQFFTQKESPFVSENGVWILESNESFSLGSTGNGAFYKDFIDSKAFEFFKKMGVSSVSIVPVDNPLADPLNPFFIGHHIHFKNDVTVQCIEQKDSKSLAGVLACKSEKVGIIEYLDLDPSMQQEKYAYLNCGIYVFSIDFIQRAAKYDLPIHKAKKKTTSFGKKIYAYKLEMFIFDAFEKAEKSSAFLTLKEKSFAPIKNLEGIDSAETAQKAIIKALNDAYPFPENFWIRYLY